jgi:DNA-binding MarR family transcriptional regulator
MPDTPPAALPDATAAAAGDLPVWFAVFNEIGILGQLSRAMFEARMPRGMVLPQFAVLNHLVRVRDGQTPLALARAFQVPKTSMTHTLGLLERAGLVRLADNPDDGRSKQVWITDAGRAFRDRTIAGLGPDVAVLAAAFPTERVAGVLPVLQDLRRVMDAMREG